jgi:hypothetical protein
MNDTVYLLGAGVNKAIKIRAGVQRVFPKTSDLYPEISPPLAKNLFQEAFAMQNRRFALEPYNERLSLLYSYIQKYWKRNIWDLENTEFDLEECFTLIQMQLKEAEENNEEQKYYELMNTQYLLKYFLSEVLSEFSEDLEGYLKYSSNRKEISHLVDCEDFRKLGEILYQEKPVILTFNYDSFIEKVIEYASGARGKAKTTASKFQNQVLEDELGYSYWNWNRALGYGINFDEVMMFDGAIGNKRKYFGADKFYTHPENSLYSWYVLKLHGSLTWFQYWSETPNPFLRDNKIELSKRYQEKETKILLEEATWIWVQQPWLHDLYIDPIIVTPILNKEQYFDNPLYSRLLRPIWSKAKDALSKCKKLVIIGYSFPPTDFLTKRMFLEAFSDNKLDELIIVNPSTEAITRAKDLCHFERPYQFNSLSEYLAYYESTKRG